VPDRDSMTVGRWEVAEPTGREGAGCMKERAAREKESRRVTLKLTRKKNK